MNTTLPVPLKDQKEKANFLLEIASTEKQLWALIHSKGLLHSDVRDLYHKVSLSYESFILNDHELTELQDVEYSLWKLHYKHIDEFRNRIKRSSANSESTASAMACSGSDDKHIEGFKSILLKATEFYKKLVVKIRSHYGLPEESSLFKRGGVTASVEPTKLQKCHFLCHRFLVCLGDVARYMEQFEKSNVQKHNWSVAATYYLEAAIIWPDSGNPQNQLAVLATYVGDEFLALYHCVRSLAVKEPFPDAWNNLILLFERNRSCHLHSLSSAARFDFLKPSERSDTQLKSQSSSNISDCCPLKGEHDHSAEKNFWPLLIRTLSFFFLKSSLEDFPCAFASTMGVLDMMIALDDIKLRALLEPYQLMDSARTGPFRALQAVSVFIFVFHNLINSPEIKGSKDGKHKQPVELIQLGLTATFIFMGRLVYRCLQANLLDTCPLLPTILVFVEWLMSILDEVEAYVLDDKTKSSMSYFFAAFIDLLKQLNGRVEVLSHERTALWEDYELRGFAPLAQIHVSLDFSTNWDQIDSYESGIEYRIKRIINAAMKIANRSNGSYKWITYDSLGMKFYAKDTNVIPERPESGKVESTNSDVCVKGLHQHISEATKECETQIANENLSNHAVDGKSVAMEEEEVILFEPLTRYNSAPLNVKINNAKGPASPNEREETVPSDECLRRATSLLIAQNQAHGDTSYFHSDISNYRCSKPFMQQEPLVKDTTALSFSEVPISAGPPSLSAWVLNRGILSSPEKGRSDVSIQGLSPVEEIATSSLSDLSIREIEYSVTSSRSEAPTNHYSPPYSAPAPSAPLLPYDAAWFNSTQSSFSDGKGSGYVNKPENFYDASRVSGYHNWSPDGQLNYGSSIPGFMDKYPPFSGMTSSEWLRQYREKRNLDRANSHMWPINYYAPGHLRNFPTPDASGFGLFDQHGVPCVSNPTIYTESSILHPGFPLVYGLEEPRREKLFHGYQRPSPYGCGAVTETRDQQQPLLWYLKEEEWLLQQDPTLRNPTYMGN
ncbi:protein SMG7L-like isoform X1 [Durio zibethinus]|uniref:Protein SMG7L-like isoform X1 n=1 Tax=Durio zibethinus TaxID=66656 RepID=A0A6P5X509_DURZI|nr:protein SMG7L-like isoform X1 [Durio zibethinus]XP_022723506.1 protein SMG7L-like isoform X1 [Durio zibethinus]